jgi:hypothetical protein
LGNYSYHTSSEHGKALKLYSLRDGKSTSRLIMITEPEHQMCLLKALAKALERIERMREEKKYPAL